MFSEILSSNSSLTCLHFEKVFIFAGSSIRVPEISILYSGTSFLWFCLTKSCSFIALLPDFFCVRGCIVKSTVLSITGFSEDFPPHGGIL